jgi:hypothetical protein
VRIHQSADHDHDNRHERLCGAKRELTGSTWPACVGTPCAVSSAAVCPTRDSLLGGGIRCTQFEVKVGRIGTRITQATAWLARSGILFEASPSSRAE